MWNVETTACDIIRMAVANYIPQKYIYTCRSKKEKVAKQSNDHDSYG